MYNLDWEDKKSLNIVWGCLNTHFKSYMVYATNEDKEDIFQVGCMALYEATLKFDENRWDSFVGYAYWVIRSKVGWYLKRSMRKNKNTISLEGFISTYFDNDEDIDSIKCMTQYEDYTEVEASELISDISKVFPNDKKLIYLLINEYKQCDIIDILKSTRSKVQTRIGAIRTYIETGVVTREKTYMDRAKVKEIVKNAIPLYEQGLSYSKIIEILEEKEMNEDNLRWAFKNNKLLDGRNRKQQKELSLVIGKEAKYLTMEQIANKHDINIHNAKRYYSFYLKGSNLRSDRKVS